jgi:heptosyltransferase-3
VRVRGNPRLRFLDRTFGVPLLRIIGLQAKRQRPSRVERFGILRTHAVGDTLLLRGVLDDARAQFPDADIVLVTGEDNAEAGQLVVSDRARCIAVSVLSPLAAMETIRRQNFDILVDASSWARLDALLAALSAARFRVGFRAEGQGRHFAFDAPVNHAPDLHQIDNYRALFRAAGVQSTTAPSLTSLTLPPSSFPLPPSFVVFHAWSGGFKGHNKEWPLDRWVQLGSRLKSLGSVAVTGGPSNAAQSGQLVASLRSAGVDAHSFTGSMTLAQTGALLRRAAAVVSVNTGIMHFAAMLGVPTVALEGPTRPSRWGPIGPRVTSVTSSFAGCGFLDLGFEYDGQRGDCMLGIEVERVAQAVHSLLGT